MSPINEKNIEQLYRNTQETVSVLEELINSINLKDIASLKSQVDHLASNVDTLIKKIFGDGVNSLETKFAISEKEILHIQDDIKDIKHEVDILENHVRDRLREINDLISSQFKDENELKKQRIIGFWKWTLIATPGGLALLKVIFDALMG